MSREVLTLSLFAGAANAFAAMLMFDLPARPAMGLCTVLAGLAGITCSARIYIVPARPAWFSSYTFAGFFSTALFLGPLFVQTLLMHTLAGPIPSWIRIAALAGASAQLIAQALKFLWLTRSEVFELRASSLLLSGRFQDLFLIRLAVLVVIAGALAQSNTGNRWIVTAAFLAALLGEWLGRYLFFVTVVPKNIAAAFTSGERMAR